MRQGGTSAAWRKTRGVVFRTMGDACVKCGDKATEVDHIIELANGGTDDIENLQPLCSTCHKAKTSQFNSNRLSKRQLPFLITKFNRWLSALSDSGLPKM